MLSGFLFRKTCLYMQANVVEVQWDSLARELYNLSLAYYSTILTLWVKRAVPSAKMGQWVGWIPLLQELPSPSKRVLLPCLLFLPSLLYMEDGSYIINIWYITETLTKNIYC